MSRLYDHQTATLSDLDLEMVQSIPPGGNWKDIPEETFSKSRRLMQIRKSGGRTTYYGRMVYDKPSYTISTYFNRPGNGCFIHPEQDRLISLREGARLQSFPDSYEFLGSRLSRYKQIGNAVPPLLAKAIAKELNGNKVVDLFAGAGGMTEGFRMAGFECVLAVDNDLNMCKTLSHNHNKEMVIYADITKEKTREKIVKIVNERLGNAELDLVAGGPPCQGFSTAGNWNEDDPRNNLLKPFVVIVEQLSPRQVLIENVLGLMWMRKGEIFEALTQHLENLGYHIQHNVLKAELYGVPQKRRRVFILGTLNKIKVGFPKPLFWDTSQKNLQFNTDDSHIFLPPPVTVREAISDLPSLQPSEGKHEIEYDESWIQADYQRWLRGLISFDDFYSRRACISEFNGSKIYFKSGARTQRTQEQD